MAEANPGGGEENNKDCGNPPKSPRLPGSPLTPENQGGRETDSTGGAREKTSERPPRSPRVPPPPLNTPDTESATPIGGARERIYVRPLRSPRLIETGTSPLTPDTEEHVADQTEIVFRNFAHQMYINDTELNQEMESKTPALPELTSFVQDPLSQASRVGRQLAQIGDDLDKKYASEFESLVSLLNITADTAYESFAGVARKVFHDGKITWSRVVTLLCFAYRMGISVLRRGIRGFFSKIVQYLCRFILVEKIAQWIADQGGWVAALRYVPETVGWPTISLIFGLAALSMAGAIYMSRR